MVRDLIPGNALASSSASSSAAAAAGTTSTCMAGDLLGSEAAPGGVLEGGGGTWERQGERERGGAGITAELKERVAEAELAYLTPAKSVLAVYTLNPKPSTQSHTGRECPGGPAPAPALPKSRDPEPEARNDPETRGQKPETSAFKGR